jgi:hypothetical protein
MSTFGTQRQQLAAVGATRARVAFACAMPANGSWSHTPYLGVITTDHKPGQPRRLGAPSP